MNYRINGSRVETDCISSKLTKVKVIAYLDYDGKDRVVIFSKIKDERGWHYERTEDTGMWKIKSMESNGCRLVQINGKDMDRYGFDEEYMNKLYKNVWRETVKLFS